MVRVYLVSFDSMKLESTIRFYNFIMCFEYL